MATKSTPQFVEVLWNTTANREATTNDCIKYAMIQLVNSQTEEEAVHWFNALNDAKQRNQMEVDQATENKAAKIPTYHFPKHQKRMAECFGNVKLRKGKKPTAQIIFD